MIERPPPNLADLLILAARYSGRPVRPEDRLYADLDINGTDFIEFVEEVERRYGVELDWVSPRNGGEATDPTIAALFNDVLSPRASARNGWKADIAKQGRFGQRKRMLGFQCWFCGRVIEPEDASAVVLTVENLWRWNTGEPLEEGDPQQSVYSHTTCAKDRLKGASMDLEPSTFLEDDED